MNKLILLFFIFVFQAQPAPISIQVRYANGQAFDQPVNILDNEGEYLSSCELNNTGRCSISLSRGLYFLEARATALDPVSAILTAETGGQWLGFTVGDAASFHSFVVDGGAIFFDSTPDGSIPHPVQPSINDIEAHYGTAHSTQAQATPTPTEKATPEPSEDDAPIPSADMNLIRRWRWLIISLVPLFIFSVWVIAVVRSQHKLG